MENTVIDVQKIQASKSQMEILKVFGNLQDGESFLLINNEDPIQLLHQLNDEKKGQFTHEYLAHGPGDWKIKITKIKKEGCCGCCGG